MLSCHSGRIQLKLKTSPRAFKVARIDFVIKYRKDVPLLPLQLRIESYALYNCLQHCLHVSNMYLGSILRLSQLFAARLLTRLVHLQQLGVLRDGVGPPGADHLSLKVSTDNEKNNRHNIYSPPPL